MTGHWRILSSTGKSSIWLVIRHQYSGLNKDIEEKKKGEIAINNQ